MNNQDIRAKILEDIYARKMKGEEPLRGAGDYAKLLAIDKNLAKFNLQSLFETGLVRGKTFHGLGDTEELPVVWGITASGIKTVEGDSDRDERLVNYPVITVHDPTGPVQIAVGEKINQNQSISIKSVEQLSKYID